MAVQEDPLFLGHSQAAGRPDRHHQRGRTLVHLIAGNHQPRVGLRDHPVALGHGDQLVDGALDRSGGVRIAGSDLGERCEQLAHSPPVLGRPKPGRHPSGILQQRVLDRRIGQTVNDRVARDESLDTRSAVFQVAVNRLGEVWFGLGPREVAQGRRRVGAEDQSGLRTARSDLGGQLTDQVLGSLTADDLQDRAAGWAPIRFATDRG